jgi:hypothetical protein
MHLFVLCLIPQQYWRTFPEYLENEKITRFLGDKDLYSYKEASDLVLENEHKGPFFLFFFYIKFLIRSVRATLMASQYSLLILISPHYQAVQAQKVLGDHFPLFRWRNGNLVSKGHTDVIELRREPCLMLCIVRSVPLCTFSLWRIQNSHFSQVLVAHACNPNYSGGRTQEDPGSLPTLGK